MANVKITDLAAYTNPDSTDVLPIVDVGADVTKKVSIADLLENAGSGTEALPGIAFDGDPDTGIYRPGEDQLALSTNGTGRLFVDSAGLVGIGSSTPGQLMVVRGSQPFLEIRDSRNKTWSGEEIFSGILFGTDDDTFTNDPQAFIKAVHTRAGTGHSSADAGLTFGTSASTTTPATERMRIDEQGRVGIGTTSPVELFHVSGSSTINARFESSTTTASIRFANSAASDGYIGYTNQNLTFTTANAERARIDSSGRLLVGTSSARSNLYTGSLSAALQIEGTSYSTSSISLVGNGINSAQNPYPIFYLGRSRGTTVGSNTVLVNGDEVGAIVFTGADGTNLIPTASIESFVDGTPGANDMPGRLVFSVTADGAASPTEALRISKNRAITVSDGGHIVLGTGTGTKIGTSTSQKIGFFDETPIVQPTTGVAEAAFVENSGGTAVNVDSTFGGYTIQQVVQALQNLGLLA